MLSAKDTASKAVRDVGKAVSGLGPSAKESEGALSQLAGGLGKLGLAGLGVETAFQAVVGGVQSVIRPALEAQQTTAQLNAVLASTGGVSGVTADQVQALSKSLAQVTVYEDDAVTSAQSLLLTFTSIGKDVFPQATETVLDMSAALGQDLQTSAMQLGKALNDPIQGVTALRRVGVQLTDAQEELVEQMVSVGDVAGAQAVILQELEREFGNSARAAGQTLAGSLQIARNQLGEVQEEIGTALIPVLTQLLHALMPVIQALADNLPGAIETVQPLLEWLGDHTYSVLIPALVALGAVAVATAASMIAAMGPIVVPITAITLALGVLVAAWESNWGDIQGKTQAVWGVLEPIFAALGEALDYFVSEGLPAIADAWARRWDEMADVFASVWQTIQSIVEAVWPIVQNLILAGTAAVRGDWTGAWEAIVAAFNQAWNQISYVVDTMVRSILETLGKLATDAGNAARGVGEAIVNSLKSAISDSAGQLKDAIMSAVNGALDAAKNAIANWKPPSIPAPSVPAPPAPKPPGKGEGEPVAGGDVATGSEGAIAWAMGKRGAPGWAGWCQKFVENAFGTTGRYASAWAAAQRLTTNTGGSLAGVPRGNLIFFRPDASNGYFGHVGISLGGGQMISATNNGPEVTGANNYWSSLFHGWGLPRFAGGVRGFGGGLALVGEAGPEVVRLPPGADVFSTRESSRLAGPTINVYGAGTQEVTERVLRYLRQRELLRAVR